MSKIFFSYSRKDSEFVDELIGKLEARGVDVWVDRGDILAGVATWRQQIVEAIMSSQVFVIVLSPNSIASDNVTKELTLAEQHAKRVLPLVIEEVKIPPSLDYQLAGLHYQTFAEGSYDENFERLARSLGALGVTLTPKEEPISNEIKSTPKAEVESQLPEQSPELETKSTPEIEPPTEGVLPLRMEEIETPQDEEPIEPGPEKEAEFEPEFTIALPPIKSEVETPQSVQTTELVPPPPVYIKETSTQTEEQANPLKKIPIWLWAVGGFLSVMILIIFFGSVFGGDNQDTYSTATQEIAQELLTEPTETLVQAPTATEGELVLPTEPTKSTPFPLLIKDDLGVEMVLVPASSFRMGTDRADALEECQRVNPSLNCDAFFFGDEEPVRLVSLDYYYYIDRYEVTNEHYDACVEAGVCDPPWNFDIAPGIQYFRVATFNQYPVVNVGWDAANDFCDWRGGRLPTEAEWEKAARGVDDARLYPWGNFLDGTNANFCDTNCGNSWANQSFNDGFEYTAPVGEFSASASLYGVEDMAGNVSEWVSDLYGPYPGGEANIDSDHFGKERVRRGGSWYSLGSDTRVSWRDKNLPAPYVEDPNAELGKIGFRCVLDVP